MATNVTLPELGENIEKGTIAKVLVSKGDSVEKEQSIIEVETDKAVVEVPSTASGTIEEVRVNDGDEISVGDVIIVVAEGGAAPKKEEKEAKEPEPEPEPEEEPEAEEPEPEPEEEPEEEEPEPEPEPAEKPAKKQKPAAKKKEAPAAKTVTYAAAPSVRKLAREIGVNIDDVRPASGTRITEEDVKAHAREAKGEAPRAPQRKSAAAAPSAPAGPTELPDFSRWGEVEREKMSTIRRRTAERLSEAWATIPHVTQNDKSDITELEAFRKNYGKVAERAGGKLTATAILVKVLALALKKFPQFNTSIDMANGEVIYKRYYNIGVAVDTDRGLLVPVIKEVDQKSIIEIAVDLNDLSERARNKKATLEEMQGGCITITNLGGIGGTGFTPIVNPPEVAILGVSRGRIEPVHKDGQFVPRMMLPLSLSYDHRIIDGADAARFTRWICEVLEQPMLIFLDS